MPRQRAWWRWIPVALLVAAAGMMLSPDAGWAHAAPVGLEPPHGAQLDHSPAALRLRFTQPVESGFSRVTVTSGRQVVSDASALHLEGDRVVVQPLPPLDPGRYDVSWRVLSIDGHVTEGSYYLDVLEGVSAGSAASGTLGEAVSPTSDASVGLYGVGTALVGGLLILLVGNRFRRRKRRQGAPVQPVDL